MVYGRDLNPVGDVAPLLVALAGVFTIGVSIYLVNKDKAPQTSGAVNAMARKRQLSF